MAGVGRRGRRGAAGQAVPRDRERPRLRRGERGSVTVEAAVALAAIVLVLALCLAAIGCLVVAVRVSDAAGEAARLAARGDQAAARAAVVRLAPHGSALSLSGGELVTARVVAAPLGGLLPGVHIGASAVAAREPDAARPAP